MDISFDALCLKSIDYKDNDKIVTLYAVNKGKISIVAKGVKKQKAKLKYAVAPLCFGHYYVNTNSKNGTLTGCDLVDSFYDVVLDPVKFYAANVVVEIIDKMGMEDDYNNELFITALKCLKELCYESDTPKKTLFTYMGRMLLALGYESKAITLRDYYNYLLHTFNVHINSLKELLLL